MRPLKLALFLALWVTLVASVSAGSILMLLTQASKSHKNIFQPLITGLADRNHTVTVASPFLGKARPNVREIVPNNFATSLTEKLGNPFELRRKGGFGMMAASFHLILDACRETYSSPEFRALEKEHFDVIFVDAIMNDCLYGWIHKMRVPFIMLSPMAAPTAFTINVGNRLPPSFVPLPMLSYSDSMSFTQRLTNVVFGFVFEIVKNFLFKDKIEQVYREALGDDKIPGLTEITRNVSMIFSNSHFTITYPRPLLPDVIEVGGMQCQPAKPLPKDLEEFVSGATDGLIYFSLGSVVQAKEMPDETRQKFVNVFRRLKQRVLWKWETGEMPNLPPNVKLSKWLPQQDILGHPNTKLFMTHGGLLSTQEAAYHGVPLLGFPIFGDQDTNMKMSERAGFALTAEILDMSEEALEKVIRQILTNPKFAERAKYLSSIYRDQAETPLERAIFWTEYVIRHRGATHMRSAARNLGFIQYYCLDVLAVLGIILSVILWGIKFTLFKLFKLIFAKPKVQGTKKKN